MTPTWWLIIVIVLALLLAVALSTYLLLRYISDLDRDASWLAKIVGVLILSLSMLTVMMLPVDVASLPTAKTDPPKPSINGDVMWQILFWLIIVSANVIGPFLSGYYEAYEHGSSTIWTQTRNGLIRASFFLFIYLVIVLILWFAGAKNSTGLDPPIKASFDDVAIGSFVLISSAVMAVSCGVGFISIPFQMFMGWIRRPRPILTQDFIEKKESIADEADALVHKGNTFDEELTLDPSLQLRRRITQFNRDTLELEERFHKLQNAYKKGGTGPLVSIFWLLGAIAAFILSLCWALQLILFAYTKVTRLFDSVLDLATDAFAPLGAFLFSFFSLYLLLCAVFGFQTLMSTIPFFNLHPLRKGDTMLNSILFNIMLGVLSGAGVVQLCVKSFSKYSLGTGIQKQMNDWVWHRQLIKHVVDVCNYIILGVSGIILLYFLINLLWCNNRGCWGKGR